MELQLHPVSSPSLLGNIYIGMVDRVLPEIGGALYQYRSSPLLLLSVGREEGKAGTSARR